MNKNRNLIKYFNLRMFDDPVEGTGSHAEGARTQARGMYCHAEGYETVTSEQPYAHAEGYRTSATYNACHAEGYETLAENGTASHAEGYQTHAKGQACHAEGQETLAEAAYGAHAEGYQTEAQGWYSHAEGNNAEAHGSSSHAEGMETVAYGTAAHAEGYGSSTNGDYTHVQNLGTYVNKSAQTAIGKWNEYESTGTSTPGTYALFVGNGTDDTDRSNALAVKWDGNVEFALDETAASGTTDGDLYAAITALGWESEVIV